MVVLNEFVDVVPSGMHRNKSATSILLKDELLGAMPTGFREVPDMLVDDDALVGGAVTYSTRPTVSCGTAQPTVADRIAHCASLNGVNATWDGAVNGNNAQGEWKLVTFNGTHEVWRDERTKLLWSDALGATNWCRASGVSGGGPYGQVDPSGYCNSGVNQDQTTPESWCTEDVGFATPAIYDSMKGGMRWTATASAPAVRWRLPTRTDFLQAEIDGIRFAVPNSIAVYWTSTMVSFDRQYASSFYGTFGGVFSVDFRNISTPKVRCIGR